MWDYKGAPHVASDDRCSRGSDRSRESWAWQLRVPKTLVVTHVLANQTSAVLQHR